MACETKSRYGEGDQKESGRAGESRVCCPDLGLFVITVITEEDMLEAAYASRPQESKRRREKRGENVTGCSEHTSALPMASPCGPSCLHGQRNGGLYTFTSPEAHAPLHAIVRTPELKNETVK